VGCGSNSEKLASSRLASQQAFAEGMTAFNNGDYADAELKLTAAIDLKGLNPDSYCDALIRRAACWAAAGKYDEALTELKSQESSGGPPDLIDVARSFVYRKQGKLGESRAALAKARKFNRAVKEFQ
jgi:Flp pilus assembly protein TadD